ncbi:uncharacterized protein LOC110933970 [Helianthus annuus]|uniref:uncharacterized protein LOC110933970 n=1 Tax=Helianthus annuus TaxID=4232 RepID=UPI000B8F4F81|nr:uncharacterized protein LOC110933970 [Helianthus annuus]
MDENSVTFLNNLDWRSKLFTIKVNVLRLWIRVNPKREGETLGIEMVVMDEQGTRMHATVWSKFMKKHEILLNEHECYYIYKSQLSVIKSNLKHFEKEHAISLNFDTSVKKCENFYGSVYGIRLASFESIKAGEVDVKYRLDFIGYVDEWSEPEVTKMKMGKDSKYINMQLLDEESSHKEEIDVVLLVQFGSFNKYKGKIMLSNAFQITRLFFNADINEIRFVEKICKTSSNGQKSISSSGNISLADDFLFKHHFYNFLDITPLDKPCELIVHGMIMSVDDKDDWYYVGCDECNRKVETTFVIEVAEDGAEEPK